MDDYMTSEDIARRLRVKLSSVHQMRYRGYLPEPDMRIGRTPVWSAERIEEWIAQRPGHGWRKGRRGRPRQQQAS